MLKHNIKKSDYASILKNDFVSLFKDVCALAKTPITWTTKTWSIISIFLLMFFISIYFIDENLRSWTLANRNPFLDSIFYLFHSYGKVQPVLVLFLVFYLGGLFSKKENIRLIGYRLFQMFIYTGITVTILKSLIGRWRPFNGVGPHFFTPFVLGPNARLSLPSGDVAIAFVISSGVASLYENILWKSFWYSMAVITATGRMYHDQHWLSDVMLSVFITISIGIWQNNYTKHKS